MGKEPKRRDSESVVTLREVAHEARETFVLNSNDIILDTGTSSSNAACRKTNETPLQDRTGIFFRGDQPSWCDFLVPLPEGWTSGAVSLGLTYSYMSSVAAGKTMRVVFSMREMNSGVDYTTAVPVTDVLSTPKNQDNVAANVIQYTELSPDGNGAVGDPFVVLSPQLLSFRLMRLPQCFEPDGTTTDVMIYSISIIFKKNITTIKKKVTDKTIDD